MTELCLPHPHSYVGAPIPSETVVGDRTVMKIIKVKWAPDIQDLCLYKKRHQRAHSLSSSYWPFACQEAKNQKPKWLTPWSWTFQSPECKKSVCWKHPVYFIMAAELTKIPFQFPCVFHCITLYLFNNSGLTVQCLNSSHLGVMKISLYLISYICLLVSIVRVTTFIQAFITQMRTTLIVN